jgi:hypothetical protein
MKPRRNKMKPKRERREKKQRTRKLRFWHMDWRGELVNHLLFGFEPI